MFKKFLILLSLLLILIGSGLYVAFQFLSYTNPAEIRMTIPRGTSISQIAKQLEAKKVISSALGFKVAILFNQKKVLLKAGDYKFEQGAHPLEILKQLIDGRVELLSMTIPEGYNLNQIYQVFKNKGFKISPDDWKIMMSNPSLLGTLPSGAVNLEGYLFPDTYLYSPSNSAAEVVGSMVATFNKQVTNELRAQATLAGFSVHQWVSLASIIEKETGLASERPMIARVFINRLAKGMLLQTDPTVIYGVENFNGNLTRTHLQQDTPYNTYTRAGLPPGPICSPGLDALKSVLNPADGDYLFFVAKGDGSHYFSANLEDHNRAVNYYQRRTGPPPTP